MGRDPIPFLKAKVTGKIAIEFEGESVFNSDVNLSLVITEKNGAQVIERLTPQIMEIASKIGDLLAQKIKEAQTSSKEDPFDSGFPHSQPLHPDEE